MSYSLNTLYQQLGVSKQAVYQSRKRQESFDAELSSLIIRADKLKAEHPGCGVEKMYYTLKPTGMGRDKFCELFLSMGYGVKRTKNHRRTTFRGHLSYPNLIEGMQVVRPFQVIQSDITYFDHNGRFYYLVLIIDVYTRIIVGYHLSDNLKSESNIKALNKAFRVMDFVSGGLIHHSDRGVQYGSQKYRDRLLAKGIHISMGEVATDNAYAERVNGIIKNEYLKRWLIKNETDLKTKTKKAIKHYNQQRKHRAHQMIYSPIEFYKNWLSLKTQNRPKVIIYTEGRKNLKGTSSPLEIYTETEPQAHNCPMVIE